MYNEFIAGPAGARLPKNIIFDSPKSDNANLIVLALRSQPQRLVLFVENGNAIILLH